VSRGGQELLSLDKSAHRLTGIIAGWQVRAGRVSHFSARDAVSVVEFARDPSEQAPGLEGAARSARRDPAQIEYKANVGACNRGATE
jgi:hypothetical protein